jgi:ribonucleoside-diphosphate reductase alpha chain
MSTKELQEFTRISRYAGYNEKEKRRESWNEQSDRVINMHKFMYEPVLPKMLEDFEFAAKMFKKKWFLGSQRGLQFAGRAILEKNARLYNCTASYCDRTRFFQEAMWLLLCGCGVGFSVQKHHIKKLPKIKAPNTRKKKTYVIPDTIEGWSDAIGVLMSTYFVKDVTFPEFEDKYVVFDSSNIRKKGALITSSGAKAPGPEPLMYALEKIRELMDSIIESGQTRLKPINAYDIVMHSSDAVLAGGVRRAATICLFSPDDKEMATAKTGNWRPENPQRGRSNNSAVLLRDSTDWETFKELIQSVKEYGEPAFVWVDDLETLFNPCVEIGMYAYDSQGRSGWSFCNLCEMNVKKAKTKEDFLKMCEAATIFGTLQAGYNKFDYLGPVSEEIVKREALLGISMTGMMDNHDIAFDPEIQKAGAAKVIETNTRIAKIIGINPSARTTCVKPAGSTSSILGTASGIHPHHSKRYFRRVQVNKMEEPLKYFKKFNPLAIEESVWSENNTDDTITFCCEVPKHVRTKVDIDAISLLDYVKLTQQNWVTHGKVKDRCVKPWLSHNVSNTINVRENEWDIVAEHIFKNRKFYTGVSLLPMSGDKDYPQAPFTTVYNEKEISEIYGKGSPMASGLIVDALRFWDDDLWAACDYVLYIGETLDIPEGLSKKEENAWKRKVNYEYKTEWRRRAIQFAERYFDGDVRKMTYCLKDVNNWKLWCDLQREYKEVPWEEFHEETNNVKAAQEIACGGGSCEITKM